MKRQGFTILELVIVLTVLGIALGIAIPRFRGLSNELLNAERETAGFFRQVRSEAMSRTSAYRAVVTSDRRLRAEFAPGCASDDDEWEVDPRVTLILQGSTSFEGVAAESTLICFNGRGVGDANPVLRVRQLGGAASDVEVFVGGGVRAAPAV